MWNNNKVQIKKPALSFGALDSISIDKEKNTIKNTGINSSLKLLFVRKNEKHNKRVIVHTIEHVIPNNIIFILSIVHS